MSDETSMYQQWQLWMLQAEVEQRRRALQREFFEYSKALSQLRRLERERHAESTFDWLRLFDEMEPKIRH